MDLVFSLRRFYNGGGMMHRKLGRTGLNVSVLGYGAWGIGGSQWVGATESASIEALRTAIEGGVNLIDTALAYGEGNSEKIVGRVVKQTLGTVYVATKVPPKNRIWPARPGIGIDEVFPYDCIIRSTEMSLKNLGTETIDLQQLHVWNPEWIGREEWRRAFEDLKSSGKVRYVGVSINDHQPDSAIELIETGLIDTVQVIYNVFDQSPEQALFPACVKHNIGVLARVPFDEGSLTGRIDERTVFPSGDFRNFYFRGERKREVVEHVSAIVGDLELDDVHKLAEIALRFCISDEAVSTVIPGMRSRASVEGNLAAANQGPLISQALEILHEHAWERNFYA
jgi:aryl-alcohol dehydrogenase-like predicted oxidoreductase